MTNILLIGGGAREHVIAETFARSNHRPRIFSYINSNNPGISSLSQVTQVGKFNPTLIKTFADIHNIDFALIGPEAPLELGVVDALEDLGVPSIAPTQELAKIETDKAFTRNLLEEFGIQGNPKHKSFNKDTIDQVISFMDSLEGIVVKPNGLTSGKGVRIQGEHFSTKHEALAYSNEILEKHSSVILEERLNGEEFSLMFLTDGVNLYPFPAVRDHKREGEWDTGNNTGGMGSYSDGGSLPFLTEKDIDFSTHITRQVMDAIYRKTNRHYRGVLYGGFILTRDGIKLIEYNARFGDPEVMNVLPLLKTDLVEVCLALLNQEQIRLDFEPSSTVCKYAVPEGYPNSPLKGEELVIGEIPNGSKIYYGSVNERNGRIYTTKSRSIACVGIADNLRTAENLAEKAISSISGRIYHRRDIGTEGLIRRSIKHIGQITNTSSIS